MLLSEFHAWLDGFTKGDLKFYPDLQEWKMIREKINEIKAEHISVVWNTPASWDKKSFTLSETPETKL